jgi:excinuclease ABC subunit A
MPQEVIRILGARQHNLKNINVEIPRNQLVVITGVSGSGKSSLAFNTLYAEGQRRYVESLSVYARQFLDQLEKPDVDFIEGLSPAIAIEQRSSSPNPRSTIATQTEIYDYLRILYAAAGQPHDPETGEPLSRSTAADIIAEIVGLPEKTRLMILAPVECGEGESIEELADRLKKLGFLRLRLDGEIVELDQQLLIENEPSAIEIVVDRIVIREDIRSRVADSVETSLRFSGSRVTALIMDENRDWHPREFVTTFTNPKTGFTLPELTPKHFSFNSHLGACPECHGLGSCLEPDPMLFVPDPDKSINDGGVKTWWSGSKSRKGAMQRLILALVAHLEQDADAPIRSMSKEFKRALFHGTKEPMSGPWNTKPKPFEGLFPYSRRLIEESKSEVTKRNVRRFLSMRDCKSCAGKRLKPSILAVTLNHEDERSSIQQFTKLSIERALVWVDGIVLTDTQKQFAPDVIREVRKRLEFLVEVGLGYLTLDRESGSLSGGESQRIRLATQLGAGLAGVLYVLDEPSIGLHQADNEKLIGTLKRLRDLGNSIIVVEHDEDTIRAADFVIDIGPKAGADGGRILALGTPEEVCASPDSVTGKFLNGIEKIEVPTRRIEPPKTPAAAGGLDSGWIAIKGANEHNLVKVDAAFPLGCLVCVTGPSGSGKSTLIDKILRRVLFKTFYQSKDVPGEHDEVFGLAQIDKAIVIDQTAIGRSPRSNPATYAGVFGPIRDLFSELPISRQRGYEPGRFSFNVVGGRCEACQGDGLIKIDMHFLSDVYVTCETCNGRRYNEETLQAVFRGRSIADVLEMSIADARDFFRKIPKIHIKLKALCDVGLGYLKMGQSATTLSGGEAQRVKLAAELGKKATGKTVYIFDEPTTGLHFEDIRILLGVLFALRNSGNTLIVIEHNLDVIKCADWVVDLGPGGGEHGGKIVAKGPPEKIAASSKSATGRYLKRYLKS